jgi:predicted nucleotidyltransferase
MRAREGDFIETFEGNIFDVKGLVHPPRRIVAFPRYVPDPYGDRKRDPKRYRKVYALSERYSFLERAFPQYLVYDQVFSEYLCEVPVEYVKHHYQPAHHLRELYHEDELDEMERRALGFAKLLKESANVSWSQLGISGSILVELHKQASDIDPVVYGSATCYKVYSALKSLLDESGNQVKRYSLKGLKELFDFRSKDTVTSFEDFVRTDSRKVLQGKFMGRDYFIRCVKNWNEVNEQYGAILYKPKGTAKIRAKVVDDSEAIFTPCRYKIDNVKILEGTRVGPIEEIVSFRGRFCEQAKNNETVIAQGKVELMQKEGENGRYRLLLGNNVSDHMVLTQD